MQTRRAQRWPVDPEAAPDGTPFTFPARLAKLVISAVQDRASVPPTNAVGPHGKVLRLFADALDQEGELREQFLMQRCGSDLELRDFRLTTRIGEGGMGVVYRAERTDGVQQSVANKVVSATVGQAGQVRFEREAQLLAQIEHPAVARLVDARVANGRAWIPRPAGASKRNRGSPRCNA